MIVRKRERKFTTSNDFSHIILDSQYDYLGVNICLCRWRLCYGFDYDIHHQNLINRFICWDDILNFLLD